MIWFYAIALILHILICIFAFLGIWGGFIDVHKYMIFPIILLPFWGIAISLMLHFETGFKPEDTAEIGVEKMKLDSELYKSITVEENDNTDAIIPMEEALIINTPRERRELIMDVLNDNPKEYIDFLRKAGNNEDTEVVHYAVTAMVEISKENDYRLQQLENSYSKDSENPQILKEYTEFLRLCLNQRLMQGRVETMNRELFADLMKKKIALNPAAEDYVHMAENYLELQNYTEAGRVINEMESLYPDDEDWVLLKLKYYAAIGKGEAIGELLRDIEEKHLYLSAKAKEAIAFWRA